MARPAARRLFFALWPEADVAAALDRAGRGAQAAWGGRRMKRDTLHLTLAFIGAVEAGQRDALVELGAGVAGRAGFDLVLDRLGGPARKRLVWAAAAQVPDALVRLVEGLRAALGEAGFDIESRPFAAHVTLLRNAAAGQETALEPAIPWPVRGVVLAQSELHPAGAAYTALARWPLAGPA